ncbi:MAG: DUF5591 domain-containing protein [Promethearchaeota archaeon]
MKTFFTLDSLQGLSRQGTIFIKEIDNEKKKKIRTPLFLIKIHPLFIRDVRYKEFLTNRASGKHFGFLLPPPGKFENLSEDIHAFLMADEFKENALFKEVYMPDLDGLHADLTNYHGFIIKKRWPSIEINSDFNARYQRAFMKQLNNLESSYKEKVIIAYDGNGAAEPFSENVVFTEDNGFLGIMLSDSNISRRTIARIAGKMKVFHLGMRQDLIRAISGDFSPAIIPVLLNFGMDMLIEKNLLTLSSRGIYFLQDSIHDITHLSDLPCSCKYCDQLMLNLNDGSLANLDVIDLYMHNLNQVIISFKNSLQMIRVRKLREYTELKSQVDIDLNVFLKKIDALVKNDVVNTTSLHVKSRVNFFSPLSYNRPIAMAFRNKVLNHFIFPEYTRYVILLPCSARKPYRFSDSHKRFHEAMSKGWKAWKSMISELIVTSPLGAVPRALEDFFPAAHYDIPVTGYWDEQEIGFSKELVAGLINQSVSSGVKIKGIIAHVDGGYRKACEEAEREMDIPFYYTGSFDKVTSKDALKLLEEKVRWVGENEGHETNDIDENAKYHYKMLLESYRALLNFQFETGLGKHVLAEGVKIRKKHGGTVYFISSETKQALIHQDRVSGNVILEELGVRRAWNAAKQDSSLNLKSIEFDGDKINGSFVFSAGVRSIKGDIKTGDDVFIHDRDGELLGYGRAIIPGREILRIKHGAAVQIVKKIKRKR